MSIDAKRHHPNGNVTTVKLPSADPSDRELSEALGSPDDILHAGSVSDWDVFTTKSTSDDSLVVGGSPLVGGPKRRKSCGLTDDEVRRVVAAVRPPKLKQPTK